MSNNTQKKQVFSVSQKYSEVFDILDRVENKSEFICQAILEKYNGSSSIEDDVLESKMRKILKDIIDKDNLFIVSGSGSIPTVQVSSAPIPVQNVTPIEEVTEAETEDEDDNYLKDIFRNM